MTATRLLFAITATWAAVLAYGALSARMLLGDGAHILLEYLQHPGQFSIIEPKRLFTFVVHQAPVLLLQRAGVESVAAYGAAYSFAVLFVPVAFMLAALFVARQQPVVFLSTAAAVSVIGFSTNFICTEVNFMAGLAILSAVLLSLQRDAPLLRGFVLPGAAFLLVLSYEGTLLTGPLLATWAALVALRRQDSLECFGLALSALLFALGTLNGLWGYLAPRDLANATGFITAIPVYLRGPHAWLLLASAAALVGALAGKGRVMWGMAVASVALGLAFLFSIWNLDGYYAYSLYYFNRAFIALFVAAFVAMLLSIWSFRPYWLDEGSLAPGAAVMVVPFAVAIASDAIGTYRWNQYVATFCSVLEREMEPQARLRGTAALRSPNGVGMDAPDDERFAPRPGQPSPRRKPGRGLRLGAFPSRPRTVAALPRHVPVAHPGHRKARLFCVAGFVSGWAASDLRR